MLELTHDQMTRMLAHQDMAAEEFYGYPDEDWQVEFQADWLQAELGVPAATYGHLFFGEAID